MIWIRTFFVVLFCLIDISFAAQKLEVCYFNTGQGNFIALKTFYANPSENKLVMIDCGGTAAGKAVIQRYSDEFSDYENPKREKLVELFKDVSECNILITHNHSDHINLINLVTKIAQSIGRVKDFIKVQLFPKEVGEYSIEQSDFIKDLLGSDVEIIHIRPTVWTDNRAQSLEHDYNSVFKLKFAGRNMLFPGDVSPQLFTILLSDPIYNQELTDVDFFTASHHGTDAAGELSGFYIVNPEMVMICSNPIEKHFLPRDIARQLIFKSERQEDILVEEHSLSTNVRSEPISSPVFVTSDSGSYYRLEINSGGLAKLFSGNSSIPCFSSNFTQKKLEQRLKAEINQLKNLCGTYCSTKNEIALSLITPYRLRFLAKNPNLDEHIYFYGSLLKNKLIEANQQLRAAQILCHIADTAINTRIDASRFRLQDLVLTDINTIAGMSPHFSGQILGLLTPILSEKTYDKSITHVYSIWEDNSDLESTPDVAMLVANLASLNPGDQIVSNFTTWAASAPHTSGLFMGTIANTVPQDKLADIRAIIDALYDKWVSEIDGETIPGVIRLVANLASLNPGDRIVTNFKDWAASASHTSGLFMGAIADTVPQNKLPALRTIIDALYGKWTSKIDDETIPDVARLVIKLSSVNYSDPIVQHFSQLGF